MGIMANAERRQETTPDLYILRGLLYCGTDSLSPAYSANGSRFYACPSLTCQRLLIRAEEVEQLVWRRFVQLNPGAADIVSRDHRRAALFQVLLQVTIGNSLNDLDYAWRD